MQLRLGLRTVIAICVALAMLFVVAAYVQYRWSNRVAVADIQREREHLETSASLFATRFNRNITDVAAYLQNNAQSALLSGAPLSTLPKIVSEVYLLDTSGPQPSVKTVDVSGRFVATAAPEWMKAMGCTRTLSQQPLAITSPVSGAFDKKTSPEQRRTSNQKLQRNRCFVALLDEDFIKSTLVPRLLQESFGDSSMKDYDFAIVSRGRGTDRIYGPEITPDFRMPFFSMSLRNVAPAQQPMMNMPPSIPKGAPFHRRPGAQQFFHNLLRSVPPQGGQIWLPPQGDEIWDLRIAHHGLPLAASLALTRRWSLLMSLLAELLIGAAIVLLIIGTYRIQRVAEQRMQFVAAVSHELRTPVSSLSMLSRNLADGLVAGPEKVTQYGELIHQQSRRLNELIEQTLQYAGVHSNLGARKRVPVAMKIVIDAALAAYSEELAREQFHVEMNVPDGLPVVQGDENLLRVAINNLLSNAIKYAKSGQWIGISAEHSLKQHAVLVHVSDRGPGIQDSEKEHLFEPFYRGQAALDAAASGSGIGLSLVRSAAQTHGGSVSIESTLGRGSTFTLSIPA